MKGQRSANPWWAVLTVWTVVNLVNILQAAGFLSRVATGDRSFNHILGYGIVALAIPAFLAMVEFMRPFLKRNRLCIPKELDDELADIFFNEFRYYWRIVAQLGEEYFDKIKKANDDFEELQWYRERKSALKKRWKATYKRGKRVQAEGRSEGTGSKDTA